MYFWVFNDFLLPSMTFDSRNPSHESRSGELDVCPFLFQIHCGYIMIKCCFRGFCFLSSWKVKLNWLVLPFFHMDGEKKRTDEWKINMGLNVWFAVSEIFTTISSATYWGFCWRDFVWNFNGICMKIIGFLVNIFIGYYDVNSKANIQNFLELWVKHFKFSLINHLHRLSHHGHASTTSATTGNLGSPQA
jgi:hypothetical protein